MFLDCIMLPDSKKTKLKSSYQAVSPSAVINIKVDLDRCCAWKGVPTVVSGGMNIARFSR